MRNNEDRLGAREGNADAPVQAANQSSDGTFSFATPTEFVELPSRGRYYSEEHPLHGKEDIEIRFMTAKDEDILTSQTLIRKGIAVDRLIENILVDKSINIDDLYIGDKNAITIAARITGYGEDYSTRVTCPSCRESSDYSFNLKECSTYVGNIPEQHKHCIEKLESGNHIVTVPASKVKVEVRLMTGRDEQYLSKLAESKRKNKLPESYLTDQLMRMIVSVNGDSSNSSRQMFVDNMPARDSKFLRGVYAEIVPNIDLSQVYACTSCDFEQEMEVPFTTEFFWPK